MSESDTKEPNNPTLDFNSTAYGVGAICTIGVMDSMVARLGLDPVMLLASMYAELMLHREVEEEAFIRALSIAKGEVAAVKKVKELRESMN